MLVTRRAVLFGAAGITAGVMLSGCDSDDADGVPSADHLRSNLQELVDDTGLDTFQRVSLSGPSFIHVVLGAEDGGEWTYTFGSDGWDDG